MDVGLVSLGDNLPHPRTGERLSPHDRFRQLVDLGALAEDLGFWSFHLGEHHFSEYILSSPTPILAAVAERTTALRLSTAVSLLPHHDPVRLAEDYGTVDVLSGGRAELVGGRGVYRAHYAQFGQDQERSAEMLAESVELLRRLWTEEDVTWSGAFRPPLDGVTVHPPRPPGTGGEVPWGAPSAPPLGAAPPPPPRSQQPPPPIWLSASSPESVDRAVALRCPIVIPTVSVGVEAPPGLVQRYREGWEQAGHDPEGGRVALHVHCHVGAGSTAETVEYWRPFQTGYLSWVLRDIAGATGPLPPHFEALATPEAQAVCGSVEDVIADLEGRIRATGGVELLMVQMDQGGLPPGEVVETVTRFSTEVLPRLRQRLASR